MICAAVGPQLSPVWFSARPQTQLICKAMSSAAASGDEWRANLLRDRAAIQQVCVRCVNADAPA